MVNEPKFLKKFLAISFEKCNFADERYIEKCSFGLEKEKDMMQVGDMKFIDFEETLDRDLGHVGTPKRDEFERNVDILADSESMMKRVAKS